MTSGTENIRVSVAMITYNHERFIAQAIESVLMQQTNFQVEIVIGEDCSTDGTRAILQCYGDRYPDRVHLLLPDQNLGMMRNFVEVMRACRGQYVALLEGDDYWTSTTKLQQQVDFLEAQPDFAICFHNVMVVNDDSTRNPRLLCPPDQKATSTLEDLLQVDFIPTLSAMFRRGLFGDFPDWYLTMGIGDWPHHILNAQYGSIGYLDEVMGVYRQHADGAYTSRNFDRRFDDIVRMYDALSRHLGHRYDYLIDKGKRRHMAELLVEKVKQAPSFTEGITIARTTLDEWLKTYELPNTWRNPAMGLVYAHYTFLGRNGGIDGRTARLCFVQMARHDPSWLKNRGVWSLGIKAFLRGVVD